jgi:hypothetical protein
VGQAKQPRGGGKGEKKREDVGPSEGREGDRRAGGAHVEKRAKEGEIATWWLARVGVGS